MIQQSAVVQSLARRSSPVVGRSLCTPAARVQFPRRRELLGVKTWQISSKKPFGLRRWSLLSGVYARGSKRSPTLTQGGKCVTWTPHSNLEKDNSLKTTPVLAQRWAVPFLVAHAQRYKGPVINTVVIKREARINIQTEIVNGERGHDLVWSVRVKG